LQGARVGSVVKNGFIELASSPLTSVLGSSRCRAQSVPKDIGSAKMCEIGTNVSFALADSDSEELDWETTCPESACRTSIISDPISSRLVTPLPTTPAWLYCSTPSMLSPAPAELISLASMQVGLCPVPTVKCLRPDSAPRDVPTSPLATTPAYVFCPTPSRSEPPTPSVPANVGSFPQELMACIGLANQIELLTPPSGQRFCPDEPLSFDGLNDAELAPSGSAISPSVSKNVGGRSGQPRIRRGPRLPPRWMDDDDDICGVSEASKPELPSPALTASPVYCYQAGHSLPSPCGQTTQITHCAPQFADFVC